MMPRSTSCLAAAGGFFADMTKPWQQGKPKQQRADMLQRLLRNLILSGPDAHLS